MTTIRFYSLINDSLKRELGFTYNIKELDIEDVFTRTQLSKIEQRPSYLYVALQFPEFNQLKNKFDLKEVHCFISPEFLLVIDKDNYKQIETFQQTSSAFLASDINPFAVFYELLDHFLTQKFTFINKFWEEIDNLEDNTFQEHDDKDRLKKILILRRNLINFISIISPMQSVLEDLQVKYRSFIDEHGIEKLDDSLDKLKKILNSMQNLNENIKLLAQIDEAIAVQSTNDTIRILTALSLVALPPTIVSSFFGMNVWFGWSVESNFYPLVFIIVTTLTSTIALYWWLKSKKWI